MKSNQVCAHGGREDSCTLCFKAKIKSMMPKAEKSAVVRRNGEVGIHAAPKMNADPTRPLDDIIRFEG